MSRLHSERLTIVHEGRGGYIEIDGVRHEIEHVEGGRFAIHLAAGQSAREREKHRTELEALCVREPTKWDVER